MSLYTWDSRLCVYVVVSMGLWVCVSVYVSTRVCVCLRCVCVFCVRDYIFIYYYRRCDAMAVQRTDSLELEAVQQSDGLKIEAVQQSDGLKI
jgi:hypothetical protein